MNNEILSRAIEECLEEMYRYAQPSISLEEIKAQGKEFDYSHYYLSNDECIVIEEKYLNMYGLEDPFNDYCDILIRDMTEGCSKDIYIKKEGYPGYRGYEDVPSLDNEIGKENLDKVVEFIKMRKDFYRFNRRAESFRFNIMNFAPNSNKEAVIEYWKKKGIDLEIEDRPKDDIFDVHYYNLTWNEYREQVRED